MGEEGRLEASADFALPDALLFVNCNPRNSARVAIEDAALKGRLYARRKKKDRLLEALTGQASVTKKADPSMRGSRAIVVQLAWQMNRRCRPTLRLPQGKKGRLYNELGGI